MADFTRRMIESWEPGQTLKLSFLGLTEIPNDIPDSVRSLSLTCNRLTEIQNLPPHLEVLYVGGNNLTKIHDNLPNTLRSIFIDNNQLSSLPETLPDSLQKIMAYGNQLSTLPKHLPSSLQMLAVNGNNIRNMPYILPDSLTFLNIAKNPLQNLPEILPTSLVHCIVRHTQIRYLPSILPPNLRFLGTEDTFLPDRLPGETVHEFHKRVELDQSKQRSVARLKSIKEDLMAATWETSRVEPWCGESWDIMDGDF